MNLFDQLLNEALKNQPNLSTLRVVVEKELLHHDILRTLGQCNFLKDLTFIGGTCLRSCYGGVRLSEDLDFTGGKDFSQTKLSTMSKKLSDNLNIKYGLAVTISEPVKDISNVATWKIKVVTRPEKKNLPAQRINIDICSVPSYDIKPMMLINPYGVDMGTSGLIIQAQSREEIYTDKLLAFALRPNRVKYRDIWDMLWLHQQGLKPTMGLISKKLQDRQLSIEHFKEEFDKRTTWIRNNIIAYPEFNKEMHRFLSAKEIQAIEQEKFWDFIISLMEGFNDQINTLI